MMELNRPVASATVYVIYRRIKECERKSGLSMPNIREMYGLSRRTVSLAVNELIDHGCIKLNTTKHKINYYKSTNHEDCALCQDCELCQ